MNRNESPLSDWRILDLTDESGIFCPFVLDVMGAEVTRVEHPGNVLKSPYFQSIASGRKESIDFSNQEGAWKFLEMAAEFDIIIESGNGYPNHFDYEELSGLNRRLIMASISPFGNTGPYKDFKASDIVLSALGGSLYINGKPDLPPLKPYGSQTYFTVSLYAASGIFLALQNLHKTGKGQFIDISIQECIASTLDHVLVRYFAQNVIAKRQGSLYWNHNFRIFPCRDGYILMTLFHNWETLVEWLAGEGMAEGLTDSRWLDAAERERNLEHIILVLEKWTRTHTAAELVQTGQAMHFPWGEVNRLGIY